MRNHGKRQRNGYGNYQHSNQFNYNNESSRGGGRGGYGGENRYLERNNNNYYGRNVSRERGYDFNNGRRPENDYHQPSLARHQEGMQREQSGGGDDGDDGGDGYGDGLHENAYTYRQQDSQEMQSLGIPSSSRTFSSRGSGTIADHQEEEQRLRGVNKDTWGNFSLDDRIKSQYEHLETYADFYLKKQILEDTDVWVKKKKQAAMHASDTLIEIMKGHASSSKSGNSTTRTTNDGKTITTYYESSDSEDSYMKDVCATVEEAENADDRSSTSTMNLPYTENFVRKFFDAMQYNLLFNIGFDVKGVNPNDDKNCFCPCSKSMRKWRNNFGIDNLNDADACGYHRRCEPLGFMSHVRKLGGGDGSSGQGGYLHRGIQLYVEFLYRDYWGEIGHKALYQLNSSDYKSSEAKEKHLITSNLVKLQNDLDRARHEVREKDLALEMEKRKSEELKAVSDKLSKQYELQKKNFDALNLEIKPKEKLDEKEMIMWRNLTRTYFQSIKRTLELRDPRIKNMKAPKEKEKITLKLPYNFVLQEFFDNQSQESAPTTSTFLFRHLNEDRIKDDNISKNHYSYKLFLDWDVKYDAALKGTLRRRNARYLKDLKDMQAVDEGGPTSQFISDVCLQLSSLSVMLPLDRDIGEVNIMIDVLRRDLHPEKGDFLTPIKGCEVEYKGERATIMEYDGVKNKAKLLKASGEIIKVKRYKFIVKKVPIALFDVFPNGILPKRDDFFENSYELYRKYSPQMNLRELEEKARQYLEAVGRFIIHVMADGRNPLPSTVLPEMMRNVLLRDCPPGSPDYDKIDIMKHLAQMHVEDFNDMYLNVEFRSFEIEKDGIITKDNFLTEFVPAFFIKPRKFNIQALRDGLTLNGEFPIHDVLRCQPLEAINQQFFSSDNAIVAQDVIDLLESNHENEVDEIALENHQLFISQTLPRALESLAENDPSFLVDFVFFVTGSRCLPQCNGIPSFKLVVLFDSIMHENNLPKTHTCENLIHIPWNVYDNNVEVSMEKLEKAVGYGKRAGFDMN